MKRRRRCKRRLKFAAVQALQNVHAALAGNVDDEIKPCMPMNEFNRQMSKKLPQPQTGQHAAGKPLRDADYDDIFTLLELRGKKMWARIPRTYVILYMTQLEELVDSFIREGLTDIFLPYSEANLPGFLVGEARKRFLASQHFVLTGKGGQLESGRSAHVNVQRSDTYFYRRNLLGEGGSDCFRSEVIHVVGKRSLKSFALKTIPRRQLDDDKHILSLFVNELHVLQSLDHRHIVRVIGSFTDQENVGILMQPVADKDLARYLNERSTTSRGVVSRQVELRLFFGCLASAVDYLHNNDSHSVQHKDIKPRNILVKSGAVFITDFGTARLRAVDDTESTEPTADQKGKRFVTKKYASPETYSGTRGYASDMWSLGCVFLEMLTVLAGQTLRDLQEFFEINGSKETIYCDNPKAIEAWLGRLDGILSASDSPADGQLTHIVRAMCRRVPGDRLTAEELVRWISGLQNAYRGQCCIGSGQPRKAKFDGPRFADPIHYDDDDDSEDDEDDDEEDGTEDDESDSETTTVEPPPTRPAGYVSPNAETETVTLVVQNKAPTNGSNVLEDVTEIVDARMDEKIDEFNPAASIRDIEQMKKVSDVTAKCQESSPLSGPRDTCTTTVFCPWPQCRTSHDGGYDQYDALREHLRGVHKVHDMGITCLMDGSREVRSIMSERDGRYTLFRTPAGPKPILPSKTYSPSHVLATTNRFFSRDSGPHESAVRPLFVYGTLTIPSVLHAQAVYFTGIPEGVYSSVQQRRLVSTAHDWNQAASSLRAAASCMMPATLRGFEGYGSRNQSVAYIDKADDEQSQVNGMLICGLQPGALACLDHLYEKEGPRSLFNEDETATREWRETQLVRQNVLVRVPGADGGLIRINAQAYIAKTHPARDRDWNMDEFLKSRSFNRLTSIAGTNSRISEEAAIAQSLGITMLLAGDEVIEKVLQDDYDGLKRLLWNGFDVDSPSLKYGTALQAAARMGNVEMMQFLLSHNAYVNARGGEYGNALIAAVVHNQFEAIKLLLRNNVRLFEPGGKYISAIYQAVDFGRLEIAHALLEKGAWLTSNYGELLDLAEERGNDEMLDKLEDYDAVGVRSRRRQRYLIKRSTPDSGGDSDADSDSDTTLRRSSGNKGIIGRIPPSAGAACLTRAFRLFNEPGKWTGIKGVEILRAGIDRGMDERILESIRPFIHSYPAIQAFFLRTIRTSNLGGDRFKAVRHTDPDEPPVNANFFELIRTDRASKAERSVEVLRRREPSPRSRSRSRR